MTDLFKLNNKNYQLENIYCFIDINNIENYLKRIETLEKEYKHQINIIIIKNRHIYNKNQLNWAIFTAKSRFVDNLNISKSMLTETLMIMSITNQIKRISKDLLLTNNNNDYYVNILSKNKIDLKQIIKSLDLKINKTNPKINMTEITKFYNLKNTKNIENEIIEKMALSLYK